MEKVFAYYSSNPV